MQALKAHVHNEPTDLPEGEVGEIIPLDEILVTGGDYLDDEERERLHESIERGFKNVEAGRSFDAGRVIAELRPRAASR